MQEKKLKPIAQIILTPVIDVVMILLLFFMIAYSRSSPQFYAQKVELPPSSSAQKETEDKKTVEIAIDAGGELILDRQKIEPSSLPEILSESKGRGVDKVIIRGDRKAPYEKIIEVMDLVKEARIEKVLLLTRKNEKGEKQP